MRCSICIIYLKYPLQREPCAAGMEALAKKKEQLKKKIIKDEVERLEAMR